MYFWDMGFSENLKRLRKATGLTQPELAKKLHCTQKAISDYETAKTFPPTEKLPVIAKFFGTTVDELMGTEEIDITSVTEDLAQKQKHGNARSVKLLELFEQLTPEEQRMTLKQVKALVDSRKRQDS